MDHEPHDVDDREGSDGGPTSAARTEETADAGFVWCTRTTTAETPAEPGFEWGGAVEDPADGGGNDDEPSTGGPASTDTADGLTLDPALVTRARGRGIDDDTVTRLAAFRHNHRRSSRQRRGRESESE